MGSQYVFDNFVRLHKNICEHLLKISTNVNSLYYNLSTTYYKGGEHAHKSQARGIISVSDNGKLPRSSPAARWFGDGE